MTKKTLDVDSFAAMREDIIACRACPRLVTWRETVATEKVKRYAHEEYWGKAVPSFGDPQARLLIVGLAPAAHGANRTGRMFTGDRSGDWLYRALHKAGFANQPQSIHAEDGLTLTDCLISATVHCAPPDNKPLPEEFAHCRPYLTRELQLMADQVQVIVALGKIAFDTVLLEFPRCFPDSANVHKPRPAFGHGAEVALSKNVMLIGSYHPSQQNTFTGKLTEPMFDGIFSRVRALF